MAHFRAAAALAMTGALALAGLAGCSDEARDEVGDAADAVGEDIENAAGSAGAMAAAEAIALGIEEDVDDDDPAANARTVAVVQENADDTPGDATITGLDDADGDGLDDDGLVQVDVGDQSACLTLAAEGDDVSADGGTCS